jgi:hypothetical protein
VATELRAGQTVATEWTKARTFRVEEVQRWPGAKAGVLVRLAAPWTGPTWVDGSVIKPLVGL